MRRSNLASTLISVAALCAALGSAASMAFDPRPAHTAGATLEAVAALPAGTFEQ